MPCHAVVNHFTLSAKKCPQTPIKPFLKLFAEALGLSLFRRQINGKPKSLENEYVFDSEDEVEDLFQLLDEIKRWDPEIEGFFVF